MFILIIIAAVLAVYGLIVLERRTAYDDTPSRRGYAQPTVDPAVGDAPVRQAAQLGQTMALCARASSERLRERGMAQDGTPYLTDGHAIVAMGRAAVAHTWPGLDPAGLASITLVQTFVAAYIAVSDPAAGHRYAQTFCAMMGVE